MALREISKTECRAAPGMLRVVMFLNAVPHHADEDVATKREAARIVNHYSQRAGDPYAVYNDRGERVSLTY